VINAAKNKKTALLQLIFKMAEKEGFEAGRPAAALICEA